MKRLLSNKGNLLFTTSMCLIIAMLGFSLMALITSVKSQSSRYSYQIYSRYTYESFSRIAVKEALNQITSAESAFHFSPLEESRTIQLRLQEALISTYINEKDEWHYGSLLPAAVTSQKIDISLLVKDLNTLIYDDLDLKHTQVLEVPKTVFAVYIDNYLYTVTVNNLRIVYTFSRNMVHCKYNTDNVVLSDSELCVYRGRANV